MVSPQKSYFLLPTLVGAAFKVRVIVDDASVKTKPQIGAKTLARIPLNTVLKAQKKKGEWFQIDMEKNGGKITGYIHEMLTEEVLEDEPAEPAHETPGGQERPRDKITAGIESSIDEGKKSVRQGDDLETAINSLRSLLATVFQVVDHRKRRELAAEIYLWIGLAYAGLDDEVSAVQERRRQTADGCLFGR